MLVHPEKALFDGEKSFPIIPSCEHFAGSEKFIDRALQLQREYGRVFDITCDCEDGAVAGREEDQVRMVSSRIASGDNAFEMMGIRIHDPSHEAWRLDIDTVLAMAGSKLAYITIPKARSAEQIVEMLRFVNERCKRYSLDREIPIHVLIETHGALADIRNIARLKNVQVLDFGQMDFVSAHHGAISSDMMRSPGQFEHPLLVRAKTEVVATALAHGLVPSHNVCLDLTNVDVVQSDASAARSKFGFLRMWSIHPAQIRPIVDAMKPDFAEVNDAADVLLAAQENDWGPIQFKGQLHDRATYRYFWTCLQRAKVSGIRIPQSARGFLQA